MLSFANYDELRQFLRKDREEKSINPIRFINVETMDMWRTVKKLLLEMSDSYITLSSFCETEDTTPNLRRMNAKLKNATKSVCVAPLSEYLRVNPQLAEQTIKDILSREYQGNGAFRIYFLMYRMKSILSSVADSDPRKNKCIIALDAGEESDYSLTIIQKELNVSVYGNEIEGFQKYLQYWEQNPDKPLVMHTANALYFENNLFFDDVKVIVTSYDLLKYHYSLPDTYKQSDGSTAEWDAFAKLTAKEKSVENAFCSGLLINRFNIDLLERWNNYSSFQKWLFWMWIRLQNQTGYVFECARDSSSVTDFIERIYCDIIPALKSPAFEKMYASRKKVLHLLNITAPDVFWKKVQQLPITDALQVLTDLTQKEKQVVYSLIQGQPFQARNQIVRLLYKSYPALAYYLDVGSNATEGTLPADIQEYFVEYRWLKVSNQLTENFVAKVKSIAEQKGSLVYQLTARNQVVTQEYNPTNSAILFVDGMGIEYLEYIGHVLSELDSSEYLISYHAGYCNLPSTTEINKDYLVGKHVIDELLGLDELKHGANYYPDNLIQELAFLDGLKEKIRDALTGSTRKVILASDHGTSRMAVLVRKTAYDDKMPAKDHKIYKYGRYCIGTDMASELPTTIEVDDKLIFADYSRFEQFGAPIDEIHGGASLEEWLVPIVTIERISTPVIKTKPIISIKTPEVQPNKFTKLCTVKFEIKEPACTDVAVIIAGKKITCTKTTSCYSFDYKPADNEETVGATLIGDSVNLGKITFTIKRGISQKKGFDI